MASQDNFTTSLYGGGFDSGAFMLLAGIIETGINEMPTALVEFTSPDKLLNLSDFVGDSAGLSLMAPDGKEQLFFGTCVSAEYKGAPDGAGHYFAEIKPWLYFLTRSHNNRIFQHMKTINIVQQVLGDYGFSGYLTINTTGEDTMRDYCVQYRETDLDFLKRLLEEDGLYFYFSFSSSESKMVISDSVSTHTAVSGSEELVFQQYEGQTQPEHVYKWETVEKAVSGKVTLDDYDFLKPRANLMVASSIPKGEHQHKSYEIYAYPGRYRETTDGERYAKQLMEAEAAGHKKWVGEGNIVNLHTGNLFTLTEHPRHASDEFMMTKAKQVFRLVVEGTNITTSLLEESYHFGLRAFEQSKTSFEAVIKAAEFRMPSVTPRPAISGVHTAVVTGPAGEEIFCDEHGRIKVQFHWDRDGNNDDATTCWIRTMMPWSGKGWGMISIPRIGQEVVIQFEEGDPDRPLCIGMLYNADNKPPYKLPEHATRSGIKTNSSMGGNGFNELVFEDKKGSEMVLLNAEKDFYQNVQHTSHTTVGYVRPNGTFESAADGAGSMKLEVENHLDEFIEKGDHRFTLDTGSQIINIMTDKTETITGKSTRTVSGDVTQEVKDGNHTNTVKSGYIMVEATAGRIDMSAAQKITLKCGGSKIVMTPTDIKITSLNVKVDAQMKFESKGGVIATMEGGVKAEVKGGAAADVKAGALLTLNGGITMIN